MTQILKHKLLRCQAMLIEPSSIVLGCFDCVVVKKKIISKPRPTDFIGFFQSCKVLFTYNLRFISITS